MERDIIKEFSEIQKMRDKLLLEIGMLYVSNYNIVKDSNLIPDINDKVLVFQKIDDRLNQLEDEVIIMGIA